jgi:hypothetical protein
MDVGGEVGDGTEAEGEWWVPEMWVPDRSSEWIRPSSRTSTVARLGSVGPELLYRNPSIHGRNGQMETLDCLCLLSRLPLPLMMLCQ